MHAQFYVLYLNVVIHSGTSNKALRILTFQDMYVMPACPSYTYIHVCMYSRRQKFVRSNYSNGEYYYFRTALCIGSVLPLHFAPYETLQKCVLRP